MTILEHINSFIQEIKIPFRKYKWGHFIIKKDIDFTRMPDLSPNSPIKSTTLIYRYRYCPKYKRLEKTFITSDNYVLSNLEIEKKSNEEVAYNINIIDKSYNRLQKLSKVI